MTAGERSKSDRLAFPQSGASRQEVCKYLGFSLLVFRRERLCRSLNGGGKGTGYELSRRGVAKHLVRLRKPASGAIFEGLRTFAPGRDWLSSILAECEIKGSNPAPGFESRAGIRMPDETRTGFEISASLLLLSRTGSRPESSALLGATKQRQPL